MANVKNVSTHVVSIRGTTIIPPLGSADIDLKTPGVPALIKRGVLEVVSTREADTAEGDGPLDPSTMKAAQLKAELDKLNVQYAGNASTDVLRELYVAKLAEQAEQAEQ